MRKQRYEEEKETKTVNLSQKINHVLSESRGKLIRFICLQLFSEMKWWDLRHAYKQTHTAVYGTSLATRKVHSL